MKQTVFLSAVAVATPLLNLPNQDLLSNEESLTKLESVVFLEEFDEVPIFGGLEFRRQWLQKAKKRSKEMNLDLLSITEALEDGIQSLSN